MINKNLLLESIVLLEDSSKISDTMAKNYRSKGYQRAKQSLISNTKILKAVLKKNNVDITKIQKDAISTAIGLKPNIQKLLKGDGDKAQIIKVILNRINTEARASIDSVEVQGGVGLYAGILFLEILLMFLLKNMFGTSIIPLLLVAFLLAPIMEEMVNRDDETKDGIKFVYNKLLSSFKLTKFLILGLVTGMFTVPISIVLVAIYMLYEMYFRLFSDKELDNVVKDTNLKKYTLVIFFVAVIGVLVAKLTPAQVSRFTKFFSSKLL